MKKLLFSVLASVLSFTFLVLNIAIVSNDSELSLLGLFPVASADDELPTVLWDEDYVYEVSTCYECVWNVDEQKYEEYACSCESEYTSCIMNMESGGPCTPETIHHPPVCPSEPDGPCY